VRFLGRVPDEDLPDLYGCADVFVMLCRDRWGGLEQEGFGIVFLEAAAAGVPAVAGASGGAAEAVEDGSTGTIVDPSDDPDVAARALASMLDDDPKRQVMGQAARARVVEQFSYARLVGVLAEGLARA
jgi:phosphatidylinositol alpha-1,6-mannosyltransferase